MKELPELPESKFGRWTGLIAGGDERAFSRFFDLYSPRLFRFILTLTRGDDGLAQEIHQITMIKVARGFKRFDTERDLLAWLRRVARNTWVDQVRHQSFVSRVMGLFRQAELPAEEPEEADCARLLNSALTELRSEEMKLVDAVYFQNKSHDEIAAELGTTRKAVESKLFRIRQHLRTVLLRRMRDEI